MMDWRQAAGLSARSGRATAKNDYVRVRYMVTEKPSDIASVNVIKLVDDVRDCVRQALGYDELGMPAPSQRSKDKRNHAKRPLRKPVNSALKSR